MKMRPKDLWKRLMIKFRGEEGLDYGGVARYFGCKCQETFCHACFEVYFFHSTYVYVFVC